MIDSRFYELINHLWRGGKYANFWTPDDGTGTKFTYWLTVGGDYTVPKMFGYWDSYFSVNPSNIRRSEHERTHIIDVDMVNTLFVEFDCKTDEEKKETLEKIANLTIQPACVVDSGGGYHCYFWLRDTYHLDTLDKRQRIADLQWAFVQWMGGDSSVNDLARVLRIPGTLNRKARFGPNHASVCIVHWDTTQQLEIADLEAELQPYIDQRDAVKAHTPTPTMGAVSLSDTELLEVLFKSKNGDMYRRLWDGKLSDAGGDHSKADQMLCNALAWLTGRDISRIDWLFRQSGLMRDKWADRQAYRENTLNNAAGSAQTVYDPQHNGAIDPVAVAAAQAAVGMNGNGYHAPPTASNTAPQQPSGANQSMDQFLLAQGPDDEGNAQSFYALYGDVFAYSETHGYMHYNGRFWETNKASAKLERCITQTLKRRQLLGLRHAKDALLKAAKPNANNARNCEYMLKSLITVSVDDFDANPELLNCNNGVVDLKTGNLWPHTSSQRFTYCVPVDYDQTADYVEWIELLAKITIKPEVVNYLQMAVGYTATGYTSEECLFYIHGPSRSGKGTFVETLLYLLGKPLAVQADFSTFTAKREGDMQNFDLAPLKPARFVAASESNKYDTLNEAKIKTATGGDDIRCAFKHKDHFQYRPQFKIWLISNHPVKGDVDDDAFWGRVKVIEFPNSFLGKEDKTLKQRMKQPAILRGVLRWMVDGAIAWFASKQGLIPPQTVIDATSARRRDLDYVQQWLDECCKLDPQAWTANADLRTSYESWCKAEGTTPKGADQFSKTLAQKNFTVGIPKRNPLGKTARGVIGLSII